MTRYSPATLQFAVDQVYSQIPIPDREGNLGLEEEHLWQELYCCILSSQVNYNLALSAARAISKSESLSPNDRPWEIVAKEVYSVLSGSFESGGRSIRYRFPAAKALQIAKSWSTIRDQSQTLVGLLSEFDDVKSLREWMVRHVPGLGPKQASMFLRNAGLSLDLAVLDRHVLRYMKISNLVEENQRLPSTLKAYQAAERVLRHYAEQNGYRVGLLDWAIWIVMRVAKSGCRSRATI